MHFSKILQIFGGLVLGCIKTKFCKKICVRQHFSSSTRFASFCTAAISKFSQKIGLKKTAIFVKFQKKKLQMSQNLQNSRTVLSEGDPSNPGFPAGRPTRFDSLWVAGPADGFPLEASELPGGGSLPLVLISPRRNQRKSNVTSLTLKREFKSSREERRARDVSASPLSLESVIK